MSPWGRLTESESIFEFFTSCSVSSVWLAGMGLNLCLPEGYLANLFVPVCTCFCLCVSVSAVTVCPSQKVSLRIY